MAEWTTAYVNDLPDSHFLYVEPGGEKDDEGKTMPRSNRHFPYQDASGAVDMPHLRNAASRIPQSNLPAAVKDELTAKCQKLLGEMNMNDAEPEAEVRQFQPRRENLVRAMAPGSLAVSEDGRTLEGHFARFNEWNLIDSAMEGRFLERIAPGAFTKTLAERTPKILFNHGKDPSIGDKVIASPASFGVDDIGPIYRGGILDGLDPLLVSGLRAGAYGSSYRFSIPRNGDAWVRDAKPAPHNPEGLPERTIREAIVYEAGPVTWPADGGTDAAVRSMTDFYTLDTLTADPERLAALIEARQGAALPPEPPTGTPEVRAVEPVAPTPTPAMEKPNVSEYVTREDKAARVAELEASIGQRAVEYPGVLPEAVQAEDDAENQEHDALVRDIAAWDARQARVASFGKEPNKTEIPAPSIIKSRTAEDIYNPDQFSGIGYRSIEERNRSLRDNAMRSLESSRLQSDKLASLLDTADEVMNEKGLPEVASRMLITGSPVYRRAFSKYLRHGNTAALTPEEQRAAALAVTGTTTTGGYAVPYIFDPTMIHIGTATPQNPFRQACRTVTITAGNNWRTVTVGAITAAYATEAAANSEGGPTFGQPSYTVQRAQAFATVSIETLEDRADITGELTSVFAEAKDTLEENEYAVGAGTTVHPLGMFTDTAYTDQATATNDVTAIADTQVAEAALPLRWRARAAWFMNRSTLRQLQALDTTFYYFSGAGLNFAGQVQPNLPVGNTGLRLLGYPIWEVPSAVSTLTTDGAIIAVLADPSSYIIVDRIGMNVEVIPNMLNGATPSFPTGQRGIYCYWRNTAKPVTALAGISLSVQ